MMTEAQRTLLELTGNTLFGKATNELVTPEVLKEADSQTVRGIIDKKAYSVFVSNVNITRAHAELENVLCGIRYVTIKGYASAYYYPEPVRRTMGDVDFLVHKEDLNRADILLQKAGFLPREESDLHRTYTKNGILFEMHSRLNGMPSDYEITHQLAESTISTAREISHEDGKIRIPDDFHSGIICLLHIISHMRSSGIGLRHFCDWACFVTYSNDVESTCREEFERIGVWQCARMFALAGVKYLGIPYQNWMGEADEDILQILMEEVMSSGNFGKARTNREMNWFVSTQSRPTMFWGFIETLTRITVTHWPITKRWKMLVPVGWIYFSFRYMIRIIMGKRNSFSVGEVLSEAENKNKLLRELKVFKH